MNRPRLREQPITEKPRVTKSMHGSFYWVEATVGDWGYCTMAPSFPEAIADAVELAARIKEGRP